jgi:hypothetical protein
VADIRAALASLGLDPETVDAEVLRALEAASGEPADDTRQPTRKPPDRAALARRKWLRTAGAAASHGDVAALLEQLPPETHAEVRRAAAEAAEARAGGAMHAAAIAAADRIEGLADRLPPDWVPPRPDRDEVSAIVSRIPR